MFQYIGEKFARAERNWATVDAVRQIADQIGATPSQVALSWVNNRPAVSATTHNRAEVATFLGQHVLSPRGTH